MTKHQCGPFQIFSGKWLPLRSCLLPQINASGFVLQGDVIRYDIVDDEAGQRASRFFWINPDTGIVVATSALGEAETSQFRVSKGCAIQLLSSAMSRNRETETVTVFEFFGNFTGRMLTCLVLPVQFTIRASDQSTPEKTASAALEVRLARDQYPPTVDFPEYTKVITENERVNGNPLVRIQARDQDLKGTLMFEVVGDLAAPSYFRVDQQGNVLVRNSLKDDIATEYVVSERREKIGSRDIVRIHSEGGFLFAAWEVT